VIQSAAKQAAEPPRPLWFGACDAQFQRVFTEELIMRRMNGWVMVGLFVSSCSDPAVEKVLGIKAAATSAPIAMIFESWNGLRQFQEHMDIAPGSGPFNLSFETYSLTNPVNVFPNGNKALHRQPITGDFTLTAKARAQAAPGWNDFSILFDYRDAQNYHFASFNEGNDQETNGLFRVRDGVLTELADFSALTLPADFSSSRSPSDLLHSVVVEWRGGQLSARRNGVLLASIPVAGVPDGLIGVGSNNDVAYWDDLKVVAYAPQPSPPSASLTFGSPSPDSNPPTVLSGLIGLLAFQDNTTGAQFRVDGTAVGGPLVNPLYSTWFDSLQVSNGVHFTTVTASTVDGRTLEASTWFDVQNSCTTVHPGGVIQLPVGPYTQRVELSWDAMPEGTPMDGGFALSRGPSQYFSGTSVSVLFGQDGTVLARNGSSYQASHPYAYRPGQGQRFQVQVDLVTKTYSVSLWTTDRHGDWLAENYAFRTGRAYDVLDYWDVIVDPTSSHGLKVCNLKISGW
jgi:hypothetical protein